MIFSVEGNMSSGKTTVLTRDKLKPFSVIENVTKWDPYLKLFYENPKRYGFLLQTVILRSQEKMLTTKNKKYDYVLTERSPSVSFQVFVDLQYEEGNLTDLEYEALKDWYENTWKPDVYIYLKTDPDICYQRWEKRNRNSEKSMDLDYLKKLHGKYEDIFNHRILKKVHIVDGNNDIDTVEKDIQRIIKQHNDELRKTS
jgi:deoxyadenosine/deoxycytidine kinase